MRRGRMNGVGKLSSRAMSACLGFMIGGGMIGTPTLGPAKELHLVIRDVDHEEAVWFPREVVIHGSTDLTEPLAFLLENPTARTHVFEAPGLFELDEEGSGMTTKPLRITLVSEETVKILVDLDRLANDAVSSEGRMVTYRFFCPLHRGDRDMGSRLLVVP